MRYHYWHLHHWRILASNGVLRVLQQVQRLLTDNKNYILDLKLSHLLDDPDLAHKNIISIPGVIETGLFIDLADTVIVANEKAELEFIS